jgi:hypothetical protein
MRRLFLLILPVALSVAGSTLPVRAQISDSGYVMPEELEPGYGIVWRSSWTQDIEEPRHRMFGVAVSPDGHWLAYNPEEGSTLRDLHNGKIVAFQSFGHRVQWSRDSRTLKHTDNRPGRDFWNVETGERRVLTGLPNPRVCSLYDIWAPDGNIYHEDCEGDSLWRILLDSSFKAGYPVEQPLNLSPLPFFPPDTTGWYITYAWMDIPDERFITGFNIVHNFDWDNRRTVRIPIPRSDSSWVFGGQNAWGQGSTFVPGMVTGPGGVVYLWLSFRAVSEWSHENTPPFTEKELEARNASGWYRVDTNGQGLVQLVRSWSGGLGISVTADGEKIYYGHLLPDTTCAVFEMDKWGRNKRQISTPWEGLAFLGVHESANNDRSATEAISARSEESNGRVVIHYSMTTPGPVTITLYDLLGRPLLRQSEHRRGNSGEEIAVALQMPNIPQGVYFVIVRSEKAASSTRIVYTR